MTNTNDTSLAARVLNALNTSGEIATGAIKASLKSSDLKGLELEHIGEAFDITIQFLPYTVSGITVARLLDRALQIHKIPHEVLIDWDMDLVIYRCGWEHYSVNNWSDDPSGLEHPIRVRMTTVNRRTFTVVLTTFLDELNAEFAKNGTARHARAFDLGTALSVSAI